VVLEALAGLEVANILDAARGKIIEQNDAIAALQQPVSEMRTDKAGAASD